MKIFVRQRLPRSAVSADCINSGEVLTFDAAGHGAEPL
jgi:hypothetical protein